MPSTEPRNYWRERSKRPKAYQGTTLQAAEKSISVGVLKGRTFRCAVKLFFCHHERASAREGSVLRLFSSLFSRAKRTAENVRAFALAKTCPSGAEAQSRC